MPKTLRKSIHDCFSKLKRCNSTTTLHSSSSPLSKNKPFLMIKNFNNNFYELISNTPKSLRSPSSTHDFSSNNNSDNDTETTPPDFATVFASQRFFFTSPGRSNSIIDSSCRFSDDDDNEVEETHKCAVAPEPDIIINGAVPVQTDSADPYMDFRQSMQEMVEASKLVDVRTNWDYLHGLLLCYLTLNPNKHTHKFIFDAFADLLVSLMMCSPSSPPSSSSPADISLRFHGDSHRLI